ncbi:MAG: ATP-grasp domain-containing protein [Lentisphaeria bacterium]|nr:ATP-grasp domain-containing protein [Lentisphaeria bacterium]
MKKIMIIAGGKWQCGIVRKAKELGYHVICSNLYPDSPAFQWADECFVANVLDYEKNLEFAEKTRPDAVITDQSDIAVRTVAKICEKLQLPGIGVETANRFSNKFMMRQFCRDHGFPCPDFCRCDTIDQAVDFYHVHGKSILKPLDSQASRGVYIIDSEDDVKKYFSLTAAYSICQKAVLIEEYIDGVEFTVDGIKTANEMVTLAISEKSHFKEYPNVASDILFSEFNDRFDYDLLRKINNSLVVAMGLPFGLTHAEYKFSKGKFFLIEIAARGGGNNISSTIVPYMSGVDSNAALIRMASGEPAGEIKVRPYDGRYVDLAFFHFAPGIVDHINGVSLLDSDPHILEYFLAYKPGEEIVPPSDDSRRAGHIIFSAFSREELNKTRKFLLEHVQVVYRN